MPWVYKNKKKRADGTTYESEKWYVKYRDPAAPGGYRQVVGHATEAASWILGERLERDAALRSEGVEVPQHKADPPVSVQAKLAEFEKRLARKNNNIEYVATTITRIRNVIAGVGARGPNDLDGPGVEAWLDERRQAYVQARRKNKRVATAERMSAGTYNGYVTAVRMFCRFAGRPLTGLSRLNTGEDLRERRALSPEDFGLLVATTRASTFVFRGLDGPHRAALYLFASFTGLRAHELSQLELDRRGQLARVTAGYSKNKRRSAVPIPPALWAQVKDWLTSQPKDRSLFPGTFWEKGAKVLRQDLAAAGIPFETAEGVYDFHSLRGQYATTLIMAGVPLPAVQKLMRLSSPQLVMKHYAKINEQALAKEAAKLPAIPVPKAPPLKLVAEAG